MLVLTRTPGETIRLNDDIVITILSVRDKKVRIGISAPDDVTVHREEVYRRIQASQPVPDYAD